MLSVSPDALRLLSHKGLDSGFRLLRRSAFRDNSMRYPVFIPVLGHIQAAERAPVSLVIRFGVCTGAKDVLVQVINAGSQPAWTGGASVAIHVDEQAL